MENKKEVNYHIYFILTSNINMYLLIVWYGIKKIPCVRVYYSLFRILSLFPICVFKTKWGIKDPKCLPDYRLLLNISRFFFFLDSFLTMLNSVVLLLLLMTVFQTTFEALSWVFTGENVICCPHLFVIYLFSI